MNVVVWEMGYIMFELLKDNITEYLKVHMPELDYSEPLRISEIGEGTLEEDGDGFLNYVFRVSDGNYRLIIKQSRTEGRRVDFPLSKERNRLEYESMKLRRAIVPQYVPEVYFYDPENYVFAMEDVSHLKISRFQLNQSVQFPKFGKQAAEYLAKTLFYTSEYYLGTRTFRDLTAHFMNHEMRSIFDTLAFMFQTSDDVPLGEVLDPEIASYIEDIVSDPKIICERYKLRECYMKRGETFIHGDFHTSNIFAGPDDMKVIDMEYTFCGPMAYDIGYLICNFISQYVCAGFRSFDSAAEQESFQQYCLDTAVEIVEEFFRQFFNCWNQDAKPIYKGVPGLKQSLKEEWLKDVIGFCANSNLGRCAGGIGYPEYDAIDDSAKRIHAKCLSLIIDKHLLLHRGEYSSIRECIRDVTAIAASYHANL